MNAWFDELSKENRGLVDLLRRKGWTKGLRQLAVDKYPDSSHFIYELLQNSEDQNAHHVTFELRQTSLTFWHDGCPFLRSDVENITGIGTSDKLQHIDKIGRFGIGFKSVFVVTDRPEIYTDLDGHPFSFAIEELFIPVFQKPRNDRLQSEGTTFVLPFRLDEAEHIYNTLQQKLHSLGADTMLFLRNLTEIAWSTEEDEGLYLCERDFDSDICSLVGETGTKNGPKISAEMQYLVFSKPIKIEGADRDLSITIAFRLENEEIVPEDESTKIYVFFPTAEMTGLRFRVHAPFLLTDNRANVQWEKPINQNLLKACALLLCDRLTVLRDMGYLTIACFDVLPTECKETSVWDGTTYIKATVYAGPQEFKVFFNTLRDAVKSGAFLLTDQGAYAKASEVKIAGTSGIRSLITPVQLGILYGSKTPLAWLSGKITEDRTPGLRKYFRDIIGVGEVDPDAFAARINEDFIVAQNDEWMSDFYSFLCDQEALWGQYKSSPSLRANPSKPIIRLENGKHVPPFKRDGSTPNAYLPSDHHSDFPTVKRCLLEDTKATVFLEKLALKQPDVVDELIQFVLPRYRAHSWPESDDQYLAEISQISAAIVNSNEVRKPDIIKELLATPFVKVYNAAGPERHSWVPPKDAIRPTSEMVVWFDGDPNIWFISHSLAEMDAWKKILQHINDPKTGIRSNIPVWRFPPRSDGYCYFYDQHGDHKRGMDGFWPYAHIDGMDFATKHMNVERASILWRLLLANGYLICGIIEYATHQTFDNAQKTPEQYSVLGQLSIDTAWLPSKHDDKFHKPSELLLSDLPEQFDTTSSNATKVAKKLGMRQKTLSEVEEVAIKIGVSAEDLSVAQRNPEEFKKWATSLAKPNFPATESPNPERRAAKVLAGVEDTAEKEYEMRQRSVRTSKGMVSEDKDTYLRDFYTNEDNVMVCQICEHAMPFQRDDGEYYFIAVECISSEIIELEHYQNHLALCPTCAAKWKVIKHTEPEVLRQSIIDCSDFAVPVILGQQNCSIRFVQKHLDDLKVILPH